MFTCYNFIDDAKVCVVVADGARRLDGAKNRPADSAFTSTGKNRSNRVGRTDEICVAKMLEAGFGMDVAGLSGSRFQKARVTNDFLKPGDVHYASRLKVMIVMSSF